MCSKDQSYENCEFECKEKKCLILDRVQNVWLNCKAKWVEKSFSILSICGFYNDNRDSKETK